MLVQTASLKPRSSASRQARISIYAGPFDGGELDQAKNKLS
jgi:hypothetical protein